MNMFIREIHQYFHQINDLDVNKNFIMQALLNVNILEIYGIWFLLVLNNKMTYFSKCQSD